MARRPASYELSPGEILLGEIMSYCVQTGMGEGMLGELALRHRGFVGLLRKRGSLRDETAERVRAFMKRWPHGTTAQQVQAAERAEARAEAGRVIAASKAAAPGLAERVKAEAAASSARKRQAQKMGLQQPISVMRGRADLVGAMIDDPGDVVAIVRRRWPEMWDQLRAQARAANMSPVERLFEAIRTGMGA